MSAATQRPPGDLHQAQSTFSYAQAAKGRSPSGPPTISMEKAVEEGADHVAASTSGNGTMDSSSVMKQVPVQRAASEGHRPQAIDRKNTSEVEPASQAIPDTNTTPASVTPPTQASSQSRVTASGPSSPDFGANSASTLLKDDDLFSNANASSDSTWEKLSQGSRSGSRSNEKMDHEKDGIPDALPDEENRAPPVPTGFREAPPPAVNFWKQRIEAKAARLPIRPVAPSDFSQAIVPTSAKEASKPFNIAAESRKHEVKKQAKRNSGGSYEKPAVVGAKDSGKPADGKAKGEDSADLGSRASIRLASVDKATPVPTAPPPPPGDAQSWPTPDSAQDEEKKKASEKADKGDKEKVPTSRAHGKEKWMPVPYVPTVQFNTPIPTVRRGARAPRGGRDAGPRGGAVASDKPNGGPPETSTGTIPNVNERSKAEVVTSGSASANARSKRSSSAGPLSVRDQRRGGEPAVSEKRKEADRPPQEAHRQDASAFPETRRAPAMTPDEGVPPKNISSNTPWMESGAANRQAPPRRVAIPNHDEGTRDYHSHPRSAGADGRGEGVFRMHDIGRDFYSPVPHRERGEGRSDRARGGYRSRGAGNHAIAHSNVPNGQTNQHSFVPPSMPHKSSYNHNYHPSQLQSSSHQSSQTHGRSFHSGSRSQSISHPASFVRQPQNGQANPGHHLPSLHTDLANAYGYQPGSQGVMSANAYNPYFNEQMSLSNMVSMQMEYYFSVDNLCKDMYLRKHMDSQGFVFLSVLAKFNRIRQLTQELEVIRHVCLNSPHIEFRTGSDGYDRVRKRDEWKQWVLAIEERDPSAQNDGANQARSPYYQQQPPNDASYNVDDRQVTQYPFTSTSSHPTSGPMPQDPLSGSPFKPNANGMSHIGNAGPASLSATVPEFSPSTSLSNGIKSLSPEAHGLVDNIFTDEQVDLLMIVVRKPLNHSAHIAPPFHSASSRTFSNGSIDGRMLANEFTNLNLEQSQNLAKSNGDNGLDLMESKKTQRPRSPLLVGSPSRRTQSNVAPPVFWVKDQDTPIDSLPDDLTHEPYNVFRRKALDQRTRMPGDGCHYDMDILYQFWSHFLIRNFNARMYQEFYQAALEDVERFNTLVGLKNLLQYYNESILGHKVVSDQIARDFVSLVKSESRLAERPAFDKLRAAWRNGAFNMKSRKKIDSMIDSSLKADLER
ncbi:MAG: hypothetical protein Q9220_003471 [cf. Caloplaca sp. 1 TL-2023]